MKSQLLDRKILSIVRPDIAEEWHPKNILKPDEVTIHDSRLVWWKCKKCGFEWESRIMNRCSYRLDIVRKEIRISKQPAICPYCPSEIVKHKKLMEEWDYEKNNAKFRHPCLAGNRADWVWWKCKKCQHSWQARFCNRVLFPNGPCPKCNTLAVRYPHLIKEYSPKNLIPIEIIRHNSDKKYLWNCPFCKNEWLATPTNRTIRGSGCPKCSKIKLKDGTVWDSKTEAYQYICLKESGKKFVHHGSYGGELAKNYYDFYIPEENKYIEITSFRKDSLNVNYRLYLRNIVKKKHYVEKVLNANFEFIKIKLRKYHNKKINEWL